MKLKDLVNYINNSNTDINRDINVRVVVHAPGSIRGGTPSSDIEQINFGIDWDNNTLLIYPKDELTKLTPEQVKEISESVKLGNSWHSYQSYKKQKIEIDKYIKEIENLKEFIDSIDFNTLTIEQRNCYQKLCNKE